MSFSKNVQSFVRSSCVLLLAIYVHCHSINAALSCSVDIVTVLMNSIQKIVNRRKREREGLPVEIVCSIPEMCTERIKS